MRRTIRLAAVATLAALAACGPDTPQFTVSGRVLNVMEQDYGQADYFCQLLANGQYMVLLTDIPACSLAHAGMSSANIFHGSSDETNLRLIFPSTLKKIPPQNTFQVGTSDCVNSSAPGTEAVAIFSHSTPGQAKYDLSVRADSGTIEVNYPTQMNALTGNFDLHFGADHISGNWSAVFCQGIGPGFGDDR